MSSVPTATERSPWPPGFSFVITTAQMRNGSRFAPASSSRSPDRLPAGAGRQPLAHQRALAVAAIGIEAVADHRLAVAHHVGHHRDDRTGHLREVDVGVGDRRGDRDRLLPDVDDAHRQILHFPVVPEPTRDEIGPITHHLIPFANCDPMPLSPYAESDIDLSWLTDFMALTKCGSFSLAAAPHHPARPLADESRRWSNAPEPPVRTRSRAVMLTDAGWRLVPWTDTLHRRASRLPGLGRAAGRRSNLFAVPHRLLRPDRGDLRAAQPRTVQLASKSLAGFGHLIGDGRAQFPARPQPSGDPLPAGPALFRPALVGLDVLALDCARRLQIYLSCYIRGRGG